MSTITVLVDGEPIEVPQGTSIIEVTRMVGKLLPHYCYHHKLSAPANCRMCSVHIANAQFPDKPYPMGCNTAVREYKDGEGNVIPMEIVTDNEHLQKMRRDIMEYLLINHPLDCPQCQQSGICDLQNYAYEHGPNTSRFTEPKVIRHTKKLGSNVSIFGNRCIACDRCVRFCKEIAGTDELTLVQRGDKTVIDIFEGHPLENPMSLCTVDICPVGALLSNDFLYKSRPWFLEPHATIVPDSKGSNVYVDVYQNRVQRIRPRENDDVNECWLADKDRLNYGFVHAKDRLRLSRRRGEEAATRQVVAEAGEALGKLAESGEGAATAVVGSAWSLNEELFLLGELATQLGVPESNRFARKHPDGELWVSASGWRIEPDQNPNREGVARFFGVSDFTDDLAELTQRIDRGEIRHLLLVGHIGGHGYTEAFIEAARKLTTLVVIDGTRTPLADFAHFSMPGTVFYEKHGTVISRVTRGHGDTVEPTLRLQRVMPCVTEPEEARQDLELLQRLAASIGKLRARPERAAAIFARLKERAEEFDGLALNEVGELGLPLERKAVAS